MQITLNRQTLGAICASGKGVGWTNAQLHALGYKNPLPADWILQLTGKVISEDDFMYLCRLGKVRSKEFKVGMKYKTPPKRVEFLKHELDYQI